MPYGPLILKSIRVFSVTHRPELRLNDFVFVKRTQLLEQHITMNRVRISLDDYSVRFLPEEECVLGTNVVGTAFETE